MPHSVPKLPPVMVRSVAAHAVPERAIVGPDHRVFPMRPRRGVAEIVLFAGRTASEAGSSAGSVSRSVFVPESSGTGGDDAEQQNSGGENRRFHQHAPYRMSRHLFR